MVLALCIAVVCGIAIGIISGLIGIGGGIVMVPLFRLGFGMAAIQATATSLFAIIPTSIAGCITHIRNHTCVPIVGVIAGLAGACTSPIGVTLASLSPDWLIMLAAGITIIFSAVKTLKKAAKPNGKAAQTEKKDSEASSKAAVQTARTASSSAATDKSKNQESFLASHKRELIGAGIGIVAGLVSGYVGVGGGFIMIPLFTAYAGISLRHASGTSLIAVAILAIPGATAQFMLGNMQILIGAAMAAGSIPGALIGANLVERVPEQSLRLVFGVMLLIAACSLVINELITL